MRYSVYFREMCIRKFIEESDWHPAHGQDYYRPLDLSVRQFYSKCETDGCDWYKWKELRKELPSLIEMVDVLEDFGYRFHQVNGITDFVERPDFELVKYHEPIVKISKNLKQSKMDCHPVLNGMLYDGEIKKRNALLAISLISKGMVIREALRQAHSSYPSIRHYGYVGCDRQMPRRTIKKVEKCIQRVREGEELKSVLRDLKLGMWSYYRYKDFFSVVLEPAQLAHLK